MTSWRASAGSFFLTLLGGVSAAADGTGRWAIRGPRSAIFFEALSPGILAALCRVGGQGAHEDELVAYVCETDGADSLPAFRAHLARLDQNGLLQRSACLGGVRLATLVPMVAPLVFVSRAVVSGESYLISRFACARREHHSLTVESSRSRARVVVHDARTAALVGALAEPGTVAELIGRVGSLPADAVTLLLTLLLNGEMLAQTRDNHCAQSEDDDLALRSWSFHDLLFHTSSRHRSAPSTSLIVENPTPVRAHQHTPADEWIDLHRSDVELASRDDPPVAWVQEARRSVREYGVKPIDLRQLSEFLYRTARAEPLPGVLHPLEIYPVVDTCWNLNTGLYYYDPMHHRLAQLCGRTSDVEQLLSDAAQSAQIVGRRLQVLLVLAARSFPSVSYALLLKQVGALFQTMYLVATAMDLAPCALGSGNSDAFARAAEMDYYSETSVGEFLLGSTR
jgi:SagB-type dehydrogenase family enzyme